jgi:hypothetical protein
MAVKPISLLEASLVETMPFLSDSDTNLNPALDASAARVRYLEAKQEYLDELEKARQEFLKHAYKV